MSDLMTTGEVAAELRVSAGTVRRLIEGRLLSAHRTHKRSGQYRVSRYDLDRYLERTRVPALDDRTERWREQAEREDAVLHRAALRIAEGTRR